MLKRLRPVNFLHQVWSWLHASTFAKICARGRKSRLEKFPKMANLGKSKKWRKQAILIIILR